MLSRNLSVALFVLIAFCAPAHAFNPFGALVGGGQSEEPGAPGQMVIEVEAPETMKGGNKVMVAGFKVIFIDYRLVTAQAKGSFLGGGTFGGKSSARVRLTGIDDATKQRITDTAYKDFVRLLKANGFEVVDHKVLAQQPGYAKLPSYDTPYRDDPMGSDTERSLFVPTSFGKVRFFTNDAAAGISVPFSTKSINTVVSDYAGKSGVIGLSVNLIVDFASSEQYAGRSYSKVTVSDILSIAPGSRVTYLGQWQGSFNPGHGSMHAKSALVSTEPFGKISDSTPDVNKTVETAVNVASALLGGGTNISNQYEIAADSAQYSTIGQKLLQDASGQFVSRLASMR
jgi:hypothetical protein